VLRTPRAKIESALGHPQLESRPPRSQRTTPLAECQIAVLAPVLHLPATAQAVVLYRTIRIGHQFLEVHIPCVPTSWQNQCTGSASKAVSSPMLALHRTGRECPSLPIRQRFSPMVGPCRVRC